MAALEDSDSSSSNSSSNARERKAWSLLVPFLTCLDLLKREAEYKRGVAGDISASRKKMAFARVSNKKKHTHCTCISHSITVFIEFHKRHNNVTEFIF